jgi:hypothetical protein
MNVKQMWINWRRLGNVGVALMENHLALVGTAFILSASTIGLVGHPYQSVIGVGWFFLAWITLSLAFTILVSMVTSPLWGAFYLRRIEADYGPKTRARVWKWFSSEAEFEADTLSIERLAWECGEYSKSDGRHFKQKLTALKSSNIAMNLTGMLLLPGSAALAFVSVPLMLCAIFIGIVMIAAGCELALRRPSKSE